MKFRLSLLAASAMVMAGLGPLVACSSDGPTGTAGNSGAGGGTPSPGGSNGQGGQAMGGSAGQATNGGSAGQGSAGMLTAGAGGSSSGQAGKASAGTAGEEDPCPNAGGMPAMGGAGAGGQGIAGMPSGGAGMSAGGTSAGAPSGGMSGMSGGGAGGFAQGGRGGRSMGGNGGMSGAGVSGGGASSGGMMAVAGSAGSGTAGSGTAGTASEDPFPPTFENLKFVLTAPTPACTASDCHGVNGPNVFQMTTRDDDFLYNSLTTHYSVNCGMTVVVPGHPEQSALVKLLKGECVGPCKTTGRMPKDCSPEMETCLPDEMISSIEKWIAAGAPR